MVKSARVENENAVKREFILKVVGEGGNPIDALMELGRSKGWYQGQRNANPDWARMIDRTRAGDFRGLNELQRTERVGDYEYFCKKYLKLNLFWHQLQWVDMLEGRPPRDLHPSETYEPGDPNYVLINCPPEHAKTMCISTHYTLWRIVRDPNERVLIISKTEKNAKKILNAIKNRLTHPRYTEMQMELGPPGGWKETADIWANDMIQFGQLQRDSIEKDPTIQAKGIGQQVYGDRATLAILDDTIVMSNAHQWEDHIAWIQQEVLTRLGDHGKLVIVGTRVDATDLYKEIRNPDLYPSGKSPWTYLAQPCVLEFAEKPEDWKTLWPRADIPQFGTNEKAGPDGLYRRWDGPAMAKRRGVVTTQIWSRAYMQQDIQEDAIFPAEMVRRSVRGMRSPGVMHKGAPGYRDKGMEGLYVVAGLDPAMTGDTAITVLGLDRHTGIRHLLDCRVKTGASPTWIRETIKEVTETLKVHEWRVEKNAFQLYLTQDPELKSHLANLGVILTEHFTGRNKLDSGYGVASMSVLFTNNLIELPNLSKSEAVRQLVEQLIIWYPETKGKTDLVMSLWFAELKCREIMQQSLVGKVSSSFAKNPFATRKQKSMRQVINLTDIAGLGALNAGR